MEIFVGVLVKDGIDHKKKFRIIENYARSDITKYLQGPGVTYFNMCALHNLLLKFSDSFRKC
jgi:hypothetical protein